MKNSTRFNGAPPPRVADHRQAKILLPVHHHARVGAKPKSSPSIAERPVNHLAWYVPLKTKESERKIPRIHQIKWKRPPKISLNPEWQVAAGEESKLTAVTPSSPLNWPLVEADCHDDSQTPIIPIIPIEEVGAEIPSDTPVTAITSAKPQPSASCPSVAECPNHVHEKSLPHGLHGLESDDLIAAGAAITFAALMQNRTIDVRLVVKYLTDLDLIEKVKSGDGLASKPEDEAQPASKSNTCLHLPSSTLASKVEKIIDVCIEPMRKAALSDATPQTVNQSLILPSSKDETDIKKCASNINICASKVGGGMHAGYGLSRQRVDLHAGSGFKKQKAGNGSPLLPCSKAGTTINKAVGKPGGMHAASGQSTPKTYNQSPLLPCTKAFTESNNGASKLGGVRAVSGSHSLKADNQSPLLPCSNAETKIIKTARKPGGMCDGSGPSTSKAAVSEINSCASKLGDVHARGPHIQKAENQSSFLPCPKSDAELNKDASALGSMLAGSGPPATKGEKRPSPSPGLNSDRPTKKLTGESGGHARPCTDQIVREQKARTLVSKDNGGSDFSGVKPLNSLSPYPSKPKMEEVKKMIHNYGSYDVSRVKPMAPPVAPPSVSPNEDMERMLDKYLSLDRRRRQPFVGPSPPLLLPTPYFNGTDTYNLSLQPMSPGHQVDLQYHQPQIQQRGEFPNINRRIEMNPIYQRPCMHFSNPARCPNGYNCPYQHDVSRQRSGGGGPPVDPRWPRSGSSLNNLERWR